MVFIKCPHKGIVFFLSFGMVIQYPFKFNRYVMEPKGFFIYPKRGIAHALNSNYGNEQYPSNSLNQNNSAHGVYIIPLRGYYFLSRFELCIFENKERFFYLSARLK
jgi:hypothetical protein